jgi:preprotein translocase subunit SecB
VKVTAGPPDHYEVAIKLEAHTSNDAGVIYHLDLTYGGIFRLQNIPEQLVQPILWVNCPSLLFPYVRRLVSDITQDGGFPPLFLEPIDFASLYAQKLAEAKAAQAERVKPDKP